MIPPGTPGGRGVSGFGAPISPNTQRFAEELQLMIQISTDQLERIRASKDIAVTSELTKKEIRNLEVKLIKLFSQLLVLRVQVTANQPQHEIEDFNRKLLKQWLRVVGITAESKKAVESKVISIDHLKEKTESEMHRTLLASTSRLRLRVKCQPR